MASERPGATEMQTLLTLLAQAERERDAALSALQQAQAHAERQHAQARQLDAYRSETQQRWSARVGRQDPIDLLRCRQGFMDRLAQAAQQQQRTCASADGGVQRARAALAERELRVASVRKLIERRLAEANRVEQQRDQKRNDEAAQRAAWERRMNARPGATIF